MAQNCSAAHGYGTVSNNLKLLVARNVWKRILNALSTFHLTPTYIARASRKATASNAKYNAKIGTHNDGLGGL